MQVFRRPRPGVQAVPSGCVATIGVFDGVHLGHQRILDRVLQEAARLGLPSLVFSFEPTPQEVMSPLQAPARLMRLREKVLVLGEAGIDHLYCPPFERALQELEPGEFIERLLVRTLGVRHLVVGDDFRFARGRTGNVRAPGSRWPAARLRRRAGRERDGGRPAGVEHGHTQRAGRRRPGHGAASCWAGPTGWRAG